MYAFLTIEYICRALCTLFTINAQNLMSYLEGINPARVVFRGLADFLDSVDVPITAFTDLAQYSELSAQGLRLL